MNSAKLWNRSFVSVFLTNLFTANCFYVLLACMPLFVVVELGLSESYIGLVMGAFSITGVIVRPFAGFLVDSFGRVKLFIFALFLFLLCTLGYVYVATFAFLLGLRLFHGIAWGLSSTAGSTIAADVVPPSRRAEGLGYYAMTMSIGMALGPALGVILLDFLPFKQVFLICVALSAFAVIAGFFVKVPPFQKSKVSFTVKNLAEKRVLGIAFMQLFYGISYGSVMGFAIVYGKKLGVINSGLFFMIFAVIMTFMRPLIGKRLDKKGPGNTMGLGFVFLMIAMLMLAMAKGQALYYGAAVAMGLGAGIVMPLLVAMAMNVVVPNRRGAANATIFTAFDGGIGLGAVLLGKAAEIFTLSTMYLFSFVILIIPLVFYYVHERSNYAKLIIK